jgi:hypothetical protein
MKLALALLLRDYIRCTATSSGRGKQADDADPIGDAAEGNKRKRKTVLNYGVIECK